VVREFTGNCLLDAEARARLQPISDDSRVVLLLLPHSSDLFLLQIGLVLCGKVPAVLPWPTTRVDGAKYQHNLIHQLNQLPADHLITLPRLARNLRPGVQFSVSECELANGNHFETMFTERFIRETGQPPRAGGRQDLPEDALFLQFSGGTTGTQKCVVVTVAMLAEQLCRLSEALKPTEADGVVSWLPL
jgi:acyl-CoA synthetase (AMP-forming)/AMP-acid ligase II